MAVIRINKTKDYTVMSNKHLKDKNMSLKAKGLLSLMLSLPDNWNYSIQGLTSICKESDKTIRTTLAELKDLNYLKMTNERTEKGRFNCIYDIFEEPICPAVKNGIGKTDAVKFPQLNTKIKKTNKEKLNKKKSYKDYDQRTYTKEELEALIEVIGTTK